MAHPKAVPVELGGKTRHLVFDFFAICPLRDRGIDALNLQDDQLMDPRVIRDLVWAGIRHEYPEVTPDDVARWIDFSNLTEVGTAITEAFLRATKRDINDPQ